MQAAFRVSTLTASSIYASLADSRRRLMGDTLRQHQHPQQNSSIHLSIYLFIYLPMDIHLSIYHLYLSICLVIEDMPEEAHNLGGRRYVGGSTLLTTGSRMFFPPGLLDDDVRYLLPTTYYLLPTTYYLLPTTYYYSYSYSSLLLHPHSCSNSCQPPFFAATEHTTSAAFMAPKQLPSRKWKRGVLKPQPKRQPQDFYWCRCRHCPACPQEGCPNGCSLELQRPTPRGGLHSQRVLQVLRALLCICTTTFTGRTVATSSDGHTCSC